MSSIPFRSRAPRTEGPDRRNDGFALGPIADWPPVKHVFDYGVLCFEGQEDSGNLDLPGARAVVAAIESGLFFVVLRFPKSGF